MDVLNTVIIILFVLTGAAVITGFLAAINAGQMDWWGRMGASNPSKKHPFWRLAVAYWGVIFGIFVLNLAISSWGGVAVLIGGCIAIYVYVTNRH